MMVRLLTLFRSKTYIMKPFYLCIVSVVSVFYLTIFLELIMIYNVVRPVIYDGVHFTYMWKTLT